MMDEQLIMDLLDVLPMGLVYLDNGFHLIVTNKTGMRHLKKLSGVGHIGAVVSHLGEKLIDEILAYDGSRVPCIIVFKEQFREVWVRRGPAQEGILLLIR